MANTAAKPSTAKPKSGRALRRAGPDTRGPQRPANPYRDPKALPRQDAAPSPDSPKPHGDDLLDAINPLRHVAKDLT